MNRGLLARLFVVAVLATAPLAPLVAISEPPARAGAAEPSLEERLRELKQTDGAGPGGTGVADREIVVVLKLAKGATPPEDVEAGQVYSREGTTLIRTTVERSEVRTLGQFAGVESVLIERTSAATDGRVADGVAAVGADHLKERGLRGDNVTVGIIGSGFRPHARDIAANVRAYRTFDAETTRWRHGTAVGSVVVDTAPGAELHLASVGTTATPEEYARAVEWLHHSDVDVILDAGSYFAQPGDGSGEIAQVASEAAEDTLFVTSAGNYGQRHWTGSHVAIGDREWVSFAAADQTNHLGGGERIAGAVRVSLRWGASPTDDDYDLYLMRQQFGADEAVAVSERTASEPQPVETIDVAVPPGRYYVAIRADNATGSHAVELFANRRLDHRTPAGSLTAPATAEGVFVVGAAGSGGAAPYSSRGPVGDRPGVDVVAPASVASTAIQDANGTSYAAPYAAGVAALLRGRYGLSADATASVLRRTATDVGPRGVDPATGHGRLDAVAAARVAGDWRGFDPANAST